MSDADPYHALLDATIEHLQELKSRGVKFIPVSPDTLAALNQPAQQATAPNTAAPMPSQSARQSTATATTSAIKSPPAHTPPPPKSSATAKVLARPPQSSAAADQADFLAPATAPVAPLPALSPEAKAAAFADLRQRALACAKCSHLASSRKNVVFGVGDPNAQLMFVGEAPGADEDEQAEPFVGRAGELLTKIIKTMGLSRETVYIGNILKCRPDTPGQSAGNRKPTPEEMQTCIPFLHEQIDLIRPKVIVALGATAVEGLLGKTIGITKLRGQWRTYRGTPLMPTYHPAYLLRNQALSEKRRVWEDMLQVMEKLGLAITEKHRNYFLKP